MMESATKAVLANKADLGIVFDTDVDRSAVIDSYGKEINRNKLIAVLSAHRFAKRTGEYHCDRFGYLFRVENIH